MKTITFYSYKGGVGRTLAVANVARYLSRFDQSVFAIDFDLESPGLHYKLIPDRTDQIIRGVVDYIYDFAVEGKRPHSLADHVVEVAPTGGAKGVLNLMPAGNVPSADYWRRLARVNWHGLFYAEEAFDASTETPPMGIHHFLELKERIEQEYQPDFLLIDSRTGITEIGGVATSVLPDAVVCLLVNNRENLEGARAVLRSIAGAERLPDQPPVEILPVLTRIPKVEEPGREQAIVQAVRDYLSEEAEELAESLSVPEVLVLHSEPELELSESLRVGGDKTPDESPLLADYLRLFGKLIPREVIRPRIGALVQEALARALDDPEGSQRSLEQLATYSEHPDAYLALLKFHRLRNASLGVQLQTAHRYWEISGDATHSLVWEIVAKCFSMPRKRRPWEPGPAYDDDDDYSPAFVRDVWRANGAKHVPVGLQVARLYAKSDSLAELRGVLADLLEHAGHTEPVVTAALQILVDADEWKMARDLIAENKSSLSKSAAFQAVWASFALKQDDPWSVEELMKDEALQLPLIEESAPLVALELMERAGIDDTDRLICSIVESVVVGPEPYSVLRDLGAIYERLGEVPAFERRLHRLLDEERVQVVARYLPKPEPDDANSWGE
jgi:MinD-like ATPase involved in chromosome partitioning or flagellar assembly